MQGFFFGKIASMLKYIGFRTLYFIWWWTRPVLLISSRYLVDIECHACTLQVLQQDGCYSQESDSHNCLKHWAMERGFRDIIFPMQACVLDTLASRFMWHFFLCPDVDTYSMLDTTHTELRCACYSLSQWAQKGKRRATNRWKKDFWQELAFRNDLELF